MEFLTHVRKKIKCIKGAKLILEIFSLFKVDLWYKTHFENFILTSKYLLCVYIQGVLKHTTALD